MQATLQLTGAAEAAMKGTPAAFANVPNAFAAARGTAVHELSTRNLLGGSVALSAVRPAPAPAHGATTRRSALERPTRTAPSSRPQAAFLDISIDAAHVDVAVMEGARPGLSNSAQAAHRVAASLT